MNSLLKKSVVFLTLLVVFQNKVQSQELDNSQISFKNKLTISLNARNLNTTERHFQEFITSTTPELNLSYFFNDQFSTGIGISSNVIFNNLSLSGRYYFFNTNDRKTNLFTESSLNASFFFIGITTSFTQKLGAEYRINENWFINLSAGGGLVFYRSGYEGPSTYITERFMPAPDFSLGVGYAF